MSIEVRDFVPVRGQKHVGEFNIYFPSMKMTLRRFKLRPSAKGGYYITAPSFMTEDAMGNKTFTPYISVENEKKFDFEKKVMELLQPEIHMLASSEPAFKF